MEKYRILLRAAIKKQKGSAAGIFLLILILSLCLFSALTLYTSGTAYVSSEMDRLGFGDFTVWVSGQPDNISAEIEASEDVEKVIEQPLIFSGYEINGSYSDNEGQLIVYDGSVPYRFIGEDGTEIPTPEIAPGEVYISPALKSNFNVKTGDTIQFELSRSSGVKSLTVAGCFADGFMGSSMIDMKSFLICGADHTEMTGIIEAAGPADMLGRNGAMLHIFQKSERKLSEREFHEEIQNSTDISLYTEFTYRKESILSYMLLLQNILSGFLIAFSAVLLIICFVVTGHSLSAAVEQDASDMAVLRALGLPGRGLRGLYFALYGGLIAAGLLLGILPSAGIAAILARSMVTSTGMLIEISAPYGLIFGISAGILLLFALFLTVRTRKIMKIAPVRTLREHAGNKRVHSGFWGRFLAFDIAVRELSAGKSRYAALCLISAFLTLFLSVIGKIGAWLGPNGEGLMNAFSVAEHDLGVQPFNYSVPMDEIERVINWYSPIKDTYELAMESVTVNGQEYTANILNDTKWFHVLSGNVCGGDSILITDTVANELGVNIGDTVRTAANGRMENYTVSGIYQCANGMGGNIGMSIEGYSKIGDITGFIWCYHYILEDGAMRDYAMAYLQKNYSGIDVHTNSWPGLDGIVLVMHTLIGVIYLLAAVFILVSAAMTTEKLLQTEAGNTAIYKSLGMPSNRLRMSFSLRFLITAAIGAVIGICLSELFADSVIGGIFGMFGIGDFHSGISPLGTLLPILAVPILFFIFAMAFSYGLKRIGIIKIISQNNE